MNDFSTPHFLLLDRTPSYGDFPGLVVKNPPSNAGNTGLTPGWKTKIPHAAGQLFSPTTTTEPAGHDQDPTEPKINKLKINLIQAEFLLKKTKTKKLLSKGLANQAP